MKKKIKKMGLFENGDAFWHFEKGKGTHFFKLSDLHFITVAGSMESFLTSASDSHASVSAFVDGLGEELPCVKTNYVSPAGPEEQSTNVLMDLYHCNLSFLTEGETIVNANSKFNSKLLLFYSLLTPKDILEIGDTFGGQGIMATNDDVKNQMDKIQNVMVRKLLASGNSFGFTAADKPKVEAYCKIYLNDLPRSKYLLENIMAKFPTSGIENETFDSGYVDEAAL